MILDSLCGKEINLCTQDIDIWFIFGCTVHGSRYIYVREFWEYFYCVGYW
jgi:hypothetical protein